LANETIAKLPSGYGLCQGMTSVVPLTANLDSGLAAGELQITENKTVGAKALHDFVALSAQLKSCPDTF
jgi:hypothetical protein